MAKTIILEKETDLGYTNPSEDLEQAISDYLAEEIGEVVDFTYLDNGDTIKVFIEQTTRKMTCYDYLLEYEYFTEQELDLVIMGWGDNEKTYNTICRVRYSMDIDQLALEDSKGGDKIILTDYPNQIGAQRGKNYGRV